MKKGAYMGKMDIKDAFRLLPIAPSDQKKLGFKHKNNYYFDRVLPQGCGSSCYLFEKFSTSIHHIFSFFAPKCNMIHYLDDFLIIAPTFELCKRYQDLFLYICETLGVPLAPHKVTVPSTECIFLGVMLDTNRKCALLPKEKLKEYQDDIKNTLKKSYISVRQLQSIIGKLSFAASVVPGRAFLRRLIRLLPKSQSDKRAIKLKKSAKLDLQTWETFLKQYNGCSFFRSLRIINGKQYKLQSDASHKGFGGTFITNWVQHSFPTSWKKHHITILEFYPLYVLIYMFGAKVSNSIVYFYCDNIAVVEIVNKLTSKNKIVMHFLRKLVILLVKMNIDLRAKHVPGLENVLCDRISRFQVDEELLKANGMNLQPTPLPVCLKPTSLAIQQAMTS